MSRQKIQFVSEPPELNPGKCDYNRYGMCHHPDSKVPMRCSMTIPNDCPLPDYIEYNIRAASSLRRLIFQVDGEIIGLVVKHRKEKS